MDVMGWETQLAVALGLLAAMFGIILGLLIYGGKIKPRQTPTSRPKRDRSMAHMLGQGDMDDVLK